MQHNLSSFLLVVLLTRINSNFDNVTKQGKVELKYKLKCKPGKTRNETGFTETIAVGNGDTEMLNEIKVGEVSVSEIKHEDKFNNLKLKIQQRKSRDSAKMTSDQKMECVSCYSGISNTDENCYSGVSSKIEKCSDFEACFVELHPLYIRRGCMLPISINRTFICKCPLCNSRPSADPTYYEYRTISDWKYDNERLQQPVVGMDLFCKVCETLGQNMTSDEICKNGLSADYVLCGHKEFCYTNIDILGDKVSRGCFKQPAYNSIHFFCNFSLCNNKSYENPTRYRNELVYRVLPMTQTSDSSTATVTGYQNFLVICLTIPFLLLFIIIERDIC